jgi:hypothetical protein
VEAAIEISFGLRPSSVATGHYATVDIPDHAGNPTCRIGQQKIYDSSYISWCPDTTDWMKVVEFSERLVDALLPLVY